MLYQRYFLKMNQSNMTNLIALLLLLCAGFLVIGAVDFVTPSFVGETESDKVVELPGSSDRLDKLLVLMCTSGCCIAIYGGRCTLSLLVTLLSKLYLFSWV